MHIYYVIWARNPKLGVWVHLGMTKCRVPLLGHCDLDLWPSFKNLHWVWCIPPIFFKVGIPYLVFGCILRWQCSKSFWVTVTLLSDLVSRIIVSWAYLFYNIWCKNPKFCVRMHLRMIECHILSLGHCDLDLLSRICINSVHIFYITLGRNHKFSLWMDLGMA